MKEKKRILFRYVLFHSFRVVGFELSVFSAIDKVSVNLRVRLAESLRFFQSHHHEGGSRASAVMQSLAITVEDKMLCCTG